MTAKPLLTQIRPTYFSVDCGMAYLIRLESGKFILIDSTFGEYDEDDHIYSLMREQNLTDAPPCVSAWFFTHPHDDHTNGFIEMSQRYKDEITVEKVEDESFFTVNHEMSKTHFISFIAYLTSDRVQFVKFYPEGNAETRFQLRGRGYIYIYCNRHGLMKMKI